MKYLFASAMLALSLAAPAIAVAPADVPSGTYKVDITHASLAWKVRHMGLANYVARFTKFDAEIKYDAAKPVNSSVSVTIDPKSVRTDYPFADKKDFDAELATGEKFFNANKFPEIKFVSTKLVKTGPTKGKLSGNLTFLGVTKPMVMDVTLSGTLKEHPYTKKPALGFSAIGVVKRSEFGMNFGIPGIADDVTLDINGEFMKAD
jgi:polyisoprenoid-binding protein YceI